MKIQEFRIRLRTAFGCEFPHNEVGMGLSKHSHLQLKRMVKPVQFLLYHSLNESSFLRMSITKLPLLFTAFLDSKHQTELYNGI